MKAYKIHLIRHAMTEENLDGKYIGQTDVPASEYGLRQIKDIIDFNYQVQVLGATRKHLVSLI